MFGSNGKMRIQIKTHTIFTHYHHFVSSGGFKNGFCLLLLFSHYFLFQGCKIKGQQTCRAAEAPKMAPLSRAASIRVLLSAAPLMPWVVSCSNLNNPPSLKITTFQIRIHHIHTRTCARKFLNTHGRSIHMYTCEEHTRARTQAPMYLTTQITLHTHPLCDVLRDMGRPNDRYTKRNKKESAPMCLGLLMMMGSHVCVCVRVVGGKGLSVGDMRGPELRIGH